MKKGILLGLLAVIGFFSGNMIVRAANDAPSGQGGSPGFGGQI